MALMVMITCELGGRFYTFIGTQWIGSGDFMAILHYFEATGGSKL